MFLSLFYIGVLGLIMGSFLNVIIYRLTLMLNLQWGDQCLVPRRHYPFIEVLTAVFSVITVFYLGFTWKAGAALVFTWSLLTLSAIDWDHQILPDTILFPLLWLGLLLNTQYLFTDPTSATIGVIFGYLILWSVYWIFKWMTKKEGMGHGDFKLSAMLGAWLGWQALPVIIFLSSLLGAIVGILLIISRQLHRNQPIPFGPFLSLCGWITLIWGDKLQYIFQLTGFV